MSATLPPDPDHALLQLLKKRVKRLRITMFVLSLLWVASVGALVFAGRRTAKTLDDSIKKLKFAEFVATYEATTDFVQPTVNTIQFLRHGYSITFDKVDYTQNGLVLSGELGNATELWISSLALNFSARPYPYKIEDKWQSQDFPWWSDEWSIGTAQTSVGVLNPGATTFFTVTIPNVKQTSDSIQIAVWFSGERYQYLGVRR